MYAALRVSPFLFQVSSSFLHRLQHCVRDLADMASLDCSVTWPRQPKEKIAHYSLILSFIGHIKLFI